MRPGGRAGWPSTGSRRHPAVPPQERFAGDRAYVEQAFPISPSGWRRGGSGAGAREFAAICMKASRLSDTGNVSIRAHEVLPASSSSQPEMHRQVTRQKASNGTEYRDQRSNCARQRRWPIRRLEQRCQPSAVETRLALLLWKKLVSRDDCSGPVSICWSRVELLWQQESSQPVQGRGHKAVIQDQWCGEGSEGFAPRTRRPEHKCQ